MVGGSAATLSSLLQEVSFALSDTLLSQYGNVGMSITVSKDGEQAFLNLGQTGIGGIPPSNETVYLISSMTKPIVALSVFILVNDKRNNISISTPVSSILGQLKHNNTSFLHHANRELRLSDLLNLRSEFHKGTNLWESPNGHVPWQTVDQIMSFLCRMPSNKAFASEASFVNERNYVNECFCLAAAIIEKATNMPWARFVQDKIFESLGMKRTSVGIDEASRRKNPSAFASFHSCRVEATVAALRSATGSRTPSYAQIEEYVESSSFITPQPVEVNPSESSSYKTAETIKSSPLAAAAGIMSTTDDLLKFSSKLLQVYSSLPQGAASHHDEVERGMAALLKYIRALPDTYTYAAGWNRVLLPWDPTILDPKPRWPGADGDNVRRLQATMKERCRDKSTTTTDTRQSCQTAWPFFRNDDKLKSSGMAPDLALYHGGNMVGANSFWFLIPRQNVAVVVLCNTRGFFLDAANLACMVLADALFFGNTHHQMKTRLHDMIPRAKIIAQRVAANYLWELVKYEEKLSTMFPDEADNDTYAAACVGRYQFCEGIFATVSEGNEGVLVFQLYGKGFEYPLRVNKRTCSDGRHETDEDTLVMTFAMPMSELTPTGVGGSNRLDVEAFVVVFGGRDQKGMFGQFAWNFARVKGVDGSPPPEFVFKRVDD
ncbi:Beta-lactamase/transpeptidase-like protein [Rhypophila decipiens]